MPFVTFKSKGDFGKTKRFFKRSLDRDYLNVLNGLGQMGVDALSRATPVDTGLTASSWIYQIERSKDKTTISWSNTNVHNGVNIAIILQYGHGTGTGGYVQGRDYINPAMRPVFDKIAELAWKEVVSS